MSLLPDAKHTPPQSRSMHCRVGFARCSRWRARRRRGPHAHGGPIPRTAPTARCGSRDPAGASDADTKHLMQAGRWPSPVWVSRSASRTGRPPRNRALRLSWSMRQRRRLVDFVPRVSATRRSSRPTDESHAALHHRDDPTMAADRSSACAWSTTFSGTRHCRAWPSGSQLRRWATHPTRRSCGTLPPAGAVGSRGGYRLLGDVDDIAVPATVQAVLAARIDRCTLRRSPF